MCFGGGGDDTNNDHPAPYPATPEGGASAITTDAVGPKKAGVNSLSQATTQQDQLAMGQANTTGLKLN